jgi:outer membrane scaffolding protein for murein synthesis (MipA/OmpV family)
MKIVKLFLLAFIVLFIFTASAQAGPKIAMGLGAAAVPDYEGSDDMEGAPLLFLDVRWDNYMSVNVLGSKAKLNLVPNPVFKAGIIAEYIAERDDVDNRQVELLPDVDSSFMVGVFAGIEKNNGDVSLEAMADASDSNSGKIVRANLGYTYAVCNDLKTRVGVFSTWADDDYMESYFGVSAAGSAASRLRTYEAESGIKDAGLNLTLNYTPWQNWGIMGLVTLKKMLGDAEDSPVVDDAGSDTQAIAGIIVTYRF